MFNFLSLLLRPERASGQITVTVTSLGHHAPLYCAARSIYLTAETVVTALDADRLFRAMSDLCNLAVELRSPAADLEEITQWRDALGLRAEQLRMQSDREERAPDLGPLDVFISRGVVDRERKRRASA